MQNKYSKVKLISSDGKELLVDEAVARKSELLKNILQDTGIEDQIFLPNVKQKQLLKLIEYCQHYKNQIPNQIEKPLPKNTLTGIVDPWDQKFIDTKVQYLLELIMAANYMNVKSLLELGCAKVATFIKGKSVQQIRTTFGIVNDFTPQQQAQIRQQNKWAQQISQ